MHTHTHAHAHTQRQHLQITESFMNELLICFWHTQREDGIGSAVYVPETSQLMSEKPFHSAFHHFLLIVFPAGVNGHDHVVLMRLIWIWKYSVIQVLHCDLSARVLLTKD